MPSRFSKGGIVSSPKFTLFSFITSSNVKFTIPCVLKTDKSSFNLIEGYEENNEKGSKRSLGSELIILV